MWTPKEVRKLVAQVAGILFGIGGVFLMLANVKATGKINISSNLVSGQIESGSAGLLLLFFAFFLILVPAIFSGRHQPVEKLKKAVKGEKSNKGQTVLQKLIISIVIGAALTTIFFIISQSETLKQYASFSNLLIVFGYCSGALTGLLILGSMFEFFEPSEENQSTLDNNKIEPIK